ncbi:Tripartite tricarboxylate transporter TctA family protein [Maioricimonas rarisocia]|uniref:Tripartite tricarboxylate transporter TctA family protein n=1 Tax=Maioricimonas rarisocia TaxID=2528026 RepID=A0A517ZFH6_9PLAN|nr:tripartite tricarboxylate transporter permease [Maioricimonas rarisocia]QDU41192.1 Tripartite tricarboxylate transporter TctA family protein [Maioricimonas rarisocia]
MPADWQTSAAMLFAPESLGLMLVGTLLGIVVGGIPGFTGAMLIALTLPLTFGMTGEQAMMLLVAMYVGSVSGGLVTATLLRMPGTPASIMTTLDGYPLAQRGEAGRALGLGVCASFIGGLVSWGALVLLAGPIARWSTLLGPFEFFALVLLALVLIASVAGRSLTRGLFSGLLGILAAMPGASPATGRTRLTFGMHELDDGFKLLPVLIGLFAVSQIMWDILTIDRPVEQTAAAPARVRMTLADWKQQAVNMLRSSGIGTIIGMLPGVGANIGSMMAYATAKSVSRTPQKFGEGSEEGIVASEAANNATVGGALIPLIALGIPGSVIDAILLGALVIHGLQPGPLLFEQNPTAVHVIMGTMFIANLVMFAAMWFSVPWLTRLAAIPRAYLVPVVLTFCTVGSFALANRMFDVWVMLAFGLIGFGMERARIPTAPFVIGFVLAPVAEEHLYAGLMQSGGSWWPLVTRPMSLVLVLVAIAMLVVTLVRHLRAAGRQEAGDRK